MPAGARGVGQGFQLALFFLFAGFGGADFVEFRVGCVDGGGFAEDADFEEAGVDGAGEVGDLFELLGGGERGGLVLLWLAGKWGFGGGEEAYKGVCLPDLVWGLF